MLPRKVWKLNVSDWLKMHLRRPVTPTGKNPSVRLGKNCILLVGGLSANCSSTLDRRFFFFFNATSSGALWTFAGAIRPRLLNDRPAVIGSSHFRQNGRQNCYSFEKSSAFMSKNQLCPALVSYRFIFNLPFVLCKTYCALFFQKLSFKPQNTTLIRFYRSYQTGKYPFFDFNFFITMHTLESKDRHSSKIKKASVL